MNKKLIALAVAGALAAPVIASAQGTNVTIFGRVQQEYSGVATGNNGGSTGDQSYQGGLNDNARSSRWGLQIRQARAKRHLLQICCRKATHPTIANKNNINTLQLAAGLGRIHLTFSN